MASMLSAFGESQTTIEKDYRRVTNLLRLKSVICHMDLDCFYVAVERRRDPSLRGKPVGLCQWSQQTASYYTKTFNEDRVVPRGPQWGGKGGGHNAGIIALSYEAKDRGVKRGMFMHDALAICPDMIFVGIPTKFGKADTSCYKDAGVEVMEVLARYGPTERVSIDEAYTDMTKISEEGFIEHMISELLSNKSDSTPEKKAKIEEEKKTVVVIADPGRATGNNDVTAAVDSALLAKKKDDFLQRNLTTKAEIARIKNDLTSKLELFSGAIDTGRFTVHGECRFYLTQQELAGRKDNLSGIVVESKDKTNLRHLIFDLEQTYKYANAARMIYEIQEKVLKDLQLSTSLGIGPTKCVSKISSGRHKPRKLSCVYPLGVREFLSTLKVTDLRGYGGKLGKDMAEKLFAETSKSNASTGAGGAGPGGGIQRKTSRRRELTVDCTLGPLFSRTILFVEQRTQRDAKTIGAFLDAMHGIDNTPVEPRLLNKIVGTSKIFHTPQHMTPNSNFMNWIHTLSEDLHQKIETEKKEANRKPMKVVVHWRTKESQNNSKTIDITCFTIDYIVNTVLKDRGPFLNLGFTAQKWVDALTGAPLKSGQAAESEPTGSLGALCMGKAIEPGSVETIDLDGNDDELSERCMQPSSSSKASSSAAPPRRSNLGTLESIPEEGTAEQHPISDNQNAMNMDSANATDGHAVSPSTSIEHKVPISFLDTTVRDDYRRVRNLLRYRNVVCHMDLDCFYVAVERRRDPTLRGLPVGICAWSQQTSNFYNKDFNEDRRRFLDIRQGKAGSGDGHMASVIALSYEAKQAGVKRGMFVQDALQACPDMILVSMPTKFGKQDTTAYREVGAEVMDIVQEYGATERVSIDECYIDITHRSEEGLLEFIIEELMENPVMPRANQAKNVASVESKDLDAIETVAEKDVDLPSKAAEQPPSPAKNHSITKEEYLEAAGNLTKDEFLHKYLVEVGQIKSIKAKLVEDMKTFVSFLEEGRLSVHGECRFYLTQEELNTGGSGHVDPTDDVVDPTIESEDPENLFYLISDLELAYKYFQGTRIMYEIQERVVNEIKLSTSLCVGPSKCVSKIASGKHKPRKLAVVYPLGVRSFQSMLKIPDLRGYGAKLGKDIAIKLFGVATVEAENKPAISSGLISGRRNLRPQKKEKAADTSLDAIYARTMRFIETRLLNDRIVVEPFLDAMHGIDNNDVDARLLTKIVGTSKRFFTPMDIEEASNGMGWFHTLSEGLAQKIESNSDGGKRKPLQIVVHWRTAKAAHTSKTIDARSFNKDYVVNTLLRDKGPFFNIGFTAQKWVDTTTNHLACEQDQKWTETNVGNVELTNGKDGNAELSNIEDSAISNAGNVEISDSENVQIPNDAAQQESKNINPIQEDEETDPKNIEATDPETIELFSGADVEYVGNEVARDVKALFLMNGDNPAGTPSSQNGLEGPSNQPALDKDGDVEMGEPEPLQTVAVIKTVDQESIGAGPLATIMIDNTMDPETGFPRESKSLGSGGFDGIGRGKALYSKDKQDHVEIPLDMSFDKMSPQTPGKSPVKGKECVLESPQKLDKDVGDSDLVVEDLVMGGDVDPIMNHSMNELGVNHLGESCNELNNCSVPGIFYENEQNAKKRGSGKRRTEVTASKQNPSKSPESQSPDANSSLQTQDSASRKHSRVLKRQESTSKKQRTSKKTSAASNFFDLTGNDVEENVFHPNLKQDLNLSALDEPGDIESTQNIFSALMADKKGSSNSKVSLSRSQFSTSKASPQSSDQKKNGASSSQKRSMLNLQSSSSMLIIPANKKQRTAEQPKINFKPSGWGSGT